MKSQLVAVLVGTLLISGCDSGSDKPGTNPVNAPTDYLGAVAKQKKKSEGMVGTLQVTSAIQQFEAAEGRQPKSIEELIDEKYLPESPKAPYGMKAEFNAETGEFRFVTE
jgi:hypothetical protein